MIFVEYWKFAIRKRKSDSDSDSNSNKNKNKNNAMQLLDTSPPPSTSRKSMHIGSSLQLSASSEFSV